MSKLRATAAEWKPPSLPSSTPAAGHGFALPQATGTVDGPGHDVSYESASSGMPTPPLRFTVARSDGNGSELGTNQAESEEVEAGATYEDWEAAMTNVKQDQYQEQDLYHDIVDEDGNVDVMELYRQMREMQRRQIEKQIADEEQYKVDVEEKRRKDKEEKIAAAPVTVNGNKRWPKKKISNFKQQQLAAKRSGFDSFSQALLNGTSPFMPALRQRCGTSLPHIKVDQRFGKRGQPHTAVMQFIVAPVVSNYRPTNFHEVTPGDLMEYHHDLALVVRAIPSASSILLSYGKEWKPFAIPYCFLNCKDYRGEVLSLCPNEVPNAKADAVYEDDVIKDVTPLIIAVPELAILKKQSIIKAMNSRANLTPMYHVFHKLFEPIGNYQIQIRDLHSTPSTFLLKTSENILRDVPKPIVIAGDPELWDELPAVDSTFASSGKALAGAARAPVSAVTTAQPQVAAPTPPQPEPVAAPQDAERKTDTRREPQEPSPPQPRTADQGGIDPLVVSVSVSLLCIIACAATVLYIRRRD